MAYSGDSESKGVGFQPGDVVRLKSGGAKLTVLGVREGGPIPLFPGLDQQAIVTAATSGPGGLLREVKAPPQCFVLVSPDEDGEDCGSPCNGPERPPHDRVAATADQYERAMPSGDKADETFTITLGTDDGPIRSRSLRIQAKAYEQALRRIAYPPERLADSELSCRTLGGLLAEAQTVARRALAGVATNGVA